jgi:hypothetical protein
MDAPDELAPHGWATSEASAPGARRGAVVALRALLVVLGHAMAAISRIDAAMRRQITRDVVVEISTADGVARHWIFDAARRTVRTRRGPAPEVDSALRFATSTQALRALLSPHCIGKIVEGIHAQTIRWEGNFLVFLWFYGLTRRIAPIGRRRRPRRPLPHPYLAHDPSSPTASYITVESPQRQLDREWHAAWEQRAKLLIIRVAHGEPTQQF